MASLKDIKQKMVAVGKTRQITSAMKMMATAKLGKAMKLLASSRAYISKLEQIVRCIQAEIETEYKSNNPQNKSKYKQTSKTPASAAFIIISGERGLCGGFNSELNEFAMSIIDQHDATDKKIVLIGKKGLNYFKKHKMNIVAHFPELTKEYDQNQLFEVAEFVYNLYVNNEAKEIYLIYSTFISQIKKYFAAPRLMPLDPEVQIIQDEEEDDKLVESFEFDPSPEELYERIIPMYIRSVIHRGLIETGAAEQSARVTAMTSATDRAKEIIDELRLDFNRTRQAMITQEISEIIAGSEI